jgi:hypothetical protein
MEVGQDLASSGKSRLSIEAVPKRGVIMQWFLICFFAIGLLCTLLGLYKSFPEEKAVSRHYCTQCGWTDEPVQHCEFERHHIITVAPMCFNCAIKRDAIPVRPSA